MRKENRKQKTNDISIFRISSCFYNYCDFFSSLPSNLVSTAINAPHALSCHYSNVCYNKWYCLNSAALARDASSQSSNSCIISAYNWFNWKMFSLAGWSKHDLMPFKLWFIEIMELEMLDIAFEASKRAGERTRTLLMKKCAVISGRIYWNDMVMAWFSQRLIITGSHIGQYGARCCTLPSASFV